MYFFCSVQTESTEMCAGEPVFILYLCRVMKRAFVFLALVAVVMFLAIGGMSHCSLSRLLPADTADTPRVDSMDMVMVTNTMESIMQLERIWIPYVRRLE